MRTEQLHLNAVSSMLFTAILVLLLGNHPNLSRGLQRLCGAGAECTLLLEGSLHSHGSAHTDTGKKTISLHAVEPHKTHFSNGHGDVAINISPVWPATANQRLKGPPSDASTSSGGELQTELLPSHSRAGQLGGGHTGIGDDASLAAQLAEEVDTPAEKTSGSWQAPCMLPESLTVYTCTTDVQVDPSPRHCP